MTEPKFTPGPWRINKGILVPDGDADTPIRVARLGLSHCELGGDKDAEYLANAHLIAAAPTMASYIQKQAALGDKEASDIWEQINAC